MAPHAGAVVRATPLPRRRPRTRRRAGERRGASPTLATLGIAQRATRPAATPTVTAPPASVGWCPEDPLPLRVSPNGRLSPNCHDGRDRRPHNRLSVDDLQERRSGHLPAQVGGRSLVAFVRAAGPSAGGGCCFDQLARLCACRSSAVACAESEVTVPWDGPMPAAALARTTFIWPATRSR